MSRYRFVPGMVAIVRLKIVCVEHFRKGSKSKLYYPMTFDISAGKIPRFFIAKTRGFQSPPIIFTLIVQRL